MSQEEILSYINDSLVINGSFYSNQNLPNQISNAIYTFGDPPFHRTQQPLCHICRLPSVHKRHLRALMKNGLSRDLPDEYSSALIYQQDLPCAKGRLPNCRKSFSGRV